MLENIEIILQKHCELFRKTVQCFWKIIAALYSSNTEDYTLLWKRKRQLYSIKLSRNNLLNVLLCGNNNKRVIFGAIKNIRIMSSIRCTLARTFRIRA